MEEEPGESEPVEPADLRSSEQSELLSLIISGEEEATAGGSDPGEEGVFANGHGEEESEPGMTTPAQSPGTSYWSITEGPDHPLLLSPVPGPSGRKPRVQRASRPGLSRIPGRDHRRYYHEYWRSEYLMDFDPQRHGMICMVCGSSLATLKLSTIKRHIRQKHPDSLLWSAADKEVIRSGWESHLSLSGGHEVLDGGSEEAVQRREAGDPIDPASPQEQPEQLLNVASPSVEAEPPLPTERKEEATDLSGPSTHTLERYLNDSLHAWFRQEFLMEYEAVAGRLLCMVCGSELPSLHLDHIKSHVLDTHPNSLVYSSEEKHCILQAWAQTHEDSENSLQSEPNTKENQTMDFSEDVDTLHLDPPPFPESDGTLTQDTCHVGEDGGVGATQPGPLVHHHPKRRRLRGGDPWRLRLDYLVAYGPRAEGTFCMVCSQVLHETKVSSFRRHIQECHPETTTLSQEDREAMAAAWTKDSTSPPGDDLHSTETPPAEVSDAPPDDVMGSRKLKQDKDRGGGQGKWRDGGGLAPRQGHYPGKDQRRNYQARWRMDYLMDYDCRRHGLICMVCSATLATLKVSTIKRHIQQVHPHSLDFSSEERQQAVLSYNQLHFIHSQDCFSPQDHGHGKLGPRS